MVVKETDNRFEVMGISRRLVFQLDEEALKMLGLERKDREGLTLSLFENGFVFVTRTCGNAELIVKKVSPSEKARVIGALLDPPEVIDGQTIKNYSDAVTFLRRPTAKTSLAEHGNIADFKN